MESKGRCGPAIPAGAFVEKCAMDAPGLEPAEATAFPPRCVPDEHGDSRTDRTNNDGRPKAPATSPQTECGQNRYWPDTLNTLPLLANLPCSLLKVGVSWSILPSSTQMCRNAASIFRRSLTW